MKKLSNQLEQTQEALLEELKLATQKVLETRKGLKGSDLVKTMEYDYKDDAFVLLAADYYTYVSTGRKPRARKVPIEDLIKWIKDKNISTRGRSISSTAFAIQQGIYRSGIKGKVYEDEVIGVDTEIISERLAEDLSNYIVDDLVDAIENN